MSEPTCETCRFWERGSRGTSEFGKQNETWWSIEGYSASKTGDCRIMPPVTNGKFPRTWENDWCGEHQPKANNK